MTDVKITLGSALRLVTVKSKRISDLIEERQEVSRKYQGDELLQRRSFRDVDVELQNEILDLITLKTGIGKVNNEKTLVFRNATISLHKANLMIDSARKEIHRLKQVLQEPKRGFIAGTRTKDDLIAIPVFSPKEIRERILELENQVQILDETRTKRNWETKINLSLINS